MKAIEMDISYLLALQNFREVTNGLLDSFMAYITTYGEELLTMMIVAAIYWCVDKRQGVYTMLTWGTGRMINGLIKVTVCAYRPWIRDARIMPVEGAKTTATGYSFPSGHTTTATAVFGSIAFSKKITKMLRCLMIFMVFIVGFSRNYLGVHTPQDVLVGCGSTVLVLLFIRWLLEAVDKKKNLDIAVLITGMIMSVCVMVYAGNKTYPIDYDATGAFIDRVFNGKYHSVEENRRNCHYNSMQLYKNYLLADGVPADHIMKFEEKEINEFRQRLILSVILGETGIISSQH